ncbi:LamG-like jellyroll fold domain-containing protein [Polaribacter atrinae]|uniref:LamG-like jellyroll fold domain-containing protein n=1 Tax=Polaribacter atrinae TaxID=1333662 RepID=UPI0024929531|nr:LamG-like jellyroll fold domain-containing protein [Polaribacter atrinae]
MKKIILFLIVLVSPFVFSQEKKKNDHEYEMKHKAKPWFAEMKDGSNYHQVKANFDTYFGNRVWDKSKPRSIGQQWLKQKLFYLDKDGFVQAEPYAKEMSQLNSPLNTFQNETTRVLGSWNLIGPVNSSETGYSGSGSHGGYVFLNRIDPTNSAKRFVSFVTGGLWVTENSGESWTIVDTNLPDDKYQDLDVAISNPDIVYAISDQQVIKSTDGGLNWASTTLIKSNYSGEAYDIAVSTSNPDIVIARWGKNIYRTTDGGVTWVSVLTGLAEHQTWDSSVHSEMVDWSTTNYDVVYSVSTSHNNRVLVHRSDDAGATFSLMKVLSLEASANGSIVGWAKLMLPSSNSNSIYVAVGSGDNPYAHRSAHLYKLNAVTGAIELTKTNMITGVGDPRNHDSYLHHGDIAMDRSNENKIVYGSYAGTKVFVSNDNGGSFTLSQATTHSDIRSVDVVDGLLLVGSDGETVDSTDDAQTLKTITNSISNHELWGFGSAFKSNLVASGNNHGPVMVKESANGFDWYNGPGADQGNTDVNPLDTRYIYSQGYSNYRFFRPGVHQITNQANSLDLGGIYSYFNSIEFHPNNYYTIITHHAGQYPTNNPNLTTWKNSLIKTEDNGNTLSIVKTFNEQVFREKISMKNPNHMYVVTGLTNNKVWHTADAGVTWTNITPKSSTTLGQKNISDIAVSDENPNEVWVTYSGVQSACKIIKSSDYGATWTNLTQANLTSFPMTKIVFQRGSDGGVYVGNKSGIYYKNNNMPNWMPLGAGLPMVDVRFMFINYNENKLKIGTSRGAFSHELYEISPPNALISSNTAQITCAAIENVQFKDYSVVRNASATWQWSFPGGTPATSNEENPEVSYVNAASGLYDVTLTVTDAYGTSTQTLTNFIEVANECGSPEPEPTPGNVASFSGPSNKDYISIGDLGLNNNSFTFSTWIKPDGIQVDYSGIFSVQDSGNDFILNFVGGNNTLGYHPNWSWTSSGLQVPPNEWSHVALVSDGSVVKIYLNGVESIHNAAIGSKAINVIDLGRYGRNQAADVRYTKLEMDEVSIWNRPLSKDEIRASRHLTKKTTDPIFNGLVAYYQFNETQGNISLNKVNNPSSSFGTYKGISGSNHIPSTAPVFSGKSQKMTINSAGIKDFDTAGVAMNFDTGTYPDGDVWVSTSTINPDVLPDGFTNFNSYTIVNNYGTNTTFTPLQSISFTGNSNFTNTTASLYNLYSRPTNAFGNTWGSKIDTADTIVDASGASTVVTFSDGLAIDTYGQFVLSNKDTSLSTEDIVLNDDKNIPIMYPNPIDKKDTFHVTLPQNWEKASIIIYNIFGQKVAKSSLKIDDNKLRLNLTSGVYTVKVFNQTKNYTKKIIMN